MGGVKVGVGVVIYKEGKILLGKRLSALGKATFGFPGGHLEVGENWENCAKRETVEEAGITIKDCSLLGVTNDIFDEKKHYITLFIKADYDQGEVRVCEADKCEYWEWRDPESLPEPLFLPIVNLLKQGQKL